MPPRFLSSEEYDEQAHRLYNEGDYDGALELLKEAVTFYPESVDLYVGLGYARVAREEFAWARRAFERALLIDSRHEDALVGLGETLLRLGEHDRAQRLFHQVSKSGFGDDVELLLTMGRALYREGLYAMSRDYFAKAASVRPESADAAASLGYALHRLGNEVAAGRQLRRSLRLNPDFYEARVYLGHILYERGEWEATLREFERVPPGAALGSTGSMADHRAQTGLGGVGRRVTRPRPLEDASSTSWRVPSTPWSGFSRTSKRRPTVGRASPTPPSSSCSPGVATTTPRGPSAGVTAAPSEVPRRRSSARCGTPRGSRKSLSGAT